MWPHTEAAYLETNPDTPATLGTGGRVCGWDQVDKFQGATPVPLGPHTAAAHLKATPGEQDFHAIGEGEEALLLLHVKVDRSQQETTTSFWIFLPFLPALSFLDI